VKLFGFDPIIRNKNDISQRYARFEITRIYHTTQKKHLTNHKIILENLIVGGHKVLELPPTKIAVVFRIKVYISF